MTDLLRQEIAALASLVVVKVGTRVVTHADGTLDDAQITRLAEELSGLLDAGRRVVLVSSGAVGAGMKPLGIIQRPKDLARLQAVAAVGQAKLIEAYDRTLSRHGRHAAQILLTADDLSDRARYLNVRNTLLALLDLGAVPIINENDTVAVEELTAAFGDNDRLAALVTNLLRAPLLVILSDVDGLFDGDPADSDSRVIETVTQFNDSLDALVRDRKTGLSKGGMASKIAAARICTTAGENVIVASGRRAGVLPRIAAGESEGTLFVAQGKALKPRKRWLGFSARSQGKLLLDGGACRAVVAQGRSLLAAGITGVEGSFSKGDLVSLCDASGAELARGLTNYSAEDIRRIQGLRSDRIAQVLGRRPYKEVIHRDNMQVTRQAQGG